VVPTSFFKSHENIAQKIVKRGLKSTVWLLTVVGKPFYILLITSINIPIIIYYTIRHLSANFPDAIDAVNSILKKPQLFLKKKEIIDTNKLQKKADKIRIKESFQNVLIQNSNRAAQIAWLASARIKSKARAEVNKFKVIFFDLDRNFNKVKTNAADKLKAGGKGFAQSIKLFSDKIPGIRNWLNAPLPFSGTLKSLQEKSSRQVDRLFTNIKDAEKDQPEQIKGGKKLEVILADRLRNKTLKLKKDILANKKLSKKINLLKSYSKITKLQNLKIKKRLADKLKQPVYTLKAYWVNIKFAILKVKLELAAFLHAIKTLTRTDKPRLLLFSLLGLFSALSLTVFVFWFVVLKDLPSPKDLTTRDVNVTTKIYDRNGMLLYNIFKDQNRSPVSLDEIPANVRLATIAIEDAEFYSHPGFSVRGMVRAFKRNVERGQLTGGSTITQQLVKNALLSSEKTMIRKTKELALAIQVELTYNKDQILEMYLNEVSYGGTAYGIQEAARMYFDKDVDELSLAEAALLAGLPKSPTHFSPFGSNPAMTKVRQKQVLNLMHLNSFITREQMEAAEKEEIEFAPNRIDIKASHFVMYVRNELERKYGKEMVEKGGLEVTTTLDYSIQLIAEQAVKEEVDRLASLNVGNGAAIVMDPANGEILAMVGSKNYFDTAADGNVNIVTTLQSPGSSIKIINYAYALANGYTPATIIDDTPITFSIQGQRPYTPRNYDGQFRGPVSLRSALAESRNIPAVKVLNSYGVINMIEMGRKMGITTWENPNRYGLALTLGGGDIKLVDLAQVYATIANYGKRPDVVTIKRVNDYKGKGLENIHCQPSDPAPLIAYSGLKTVSASTQSAYTININTSEACGGEQVIDPRIAFIITDILKDNNARAPAFGSNSQLVIPNHKEVAVKTGTSNDLRDNLTLGYNQNYLVAVWVGNNDNSPMSRIASGVTGAALIFNKIMSTILEKEGNHDWDVPPGLVKVKICSITGTLPCEGCPSREEWFLEENQPTSHCSSEFFEDDDKDKERGNRRRRFIFPLEIFDGN
jgi:penicillin-binding protein 1C